MGCLSAAPAAIISGSVTYSSETIGAFGDWSIQFTSTNPDTVLQRVTVDLSPTNLFFDTTSGAPGYMLWQDFTPTGGSAAATGLSEVNPGTGSVLNGSTWLELVFTNFTSANGPFTFQLDVDGPANYTGCGGGILGLLCRAGRDIDASLVTSQEIAGALVSMQFYTPGVGVNLVSTNLGQVGAHTAYGTFATPEPATYMLIAAGLGLFALRRRSS
jgi:hypothetical protein